MAMDQNDGSSFLRAPAWAPFFTPSQYADFTRLFTEDLARRGMTWREDDGCAVIQLGGGRTQRMGLLNLAQSCRSDPPARWSRTVREFLDGVLHVEDALAGMLARMEDLDQIRRQLKLRVHSDDYRQTPGFGELASRPVADGLLTLVVCDMGKVNISLPKAVSAGWRISDDELFALALKNTLEQEPVVHLPMPPLPGGVVLEGIEGHNNYAATHLLGLERHLGRGDGYGVLVVVPNRHLIGLHRLRDEAQMNIAMQALLSIAEAAYQDGPGSISRDVYWWRPERPLKRLPVLRRADRERAAVAGRERDSAAVADRERAAVAGRERDSAAVAGRERDSAAVADRVEIHADAEFYRAVVLPMSRGN